MSTRPRGRKAEPPKLISAYVIDMMSMMEAEIINFGRNPQQNKKLLLLHCQSIVS